jgi:hypothetical protein
VRTSRSLARPRALRIGLLAILPFAILALAAPSTALAAGSTTVSAHVSPSHPGGSAKRVEIRRPDQEEECTTTTGRSQTPATEVLLGWAYIVCEGDAPPAECSQQADLQIFSATIGWVRIAEGAVEYGCNGLVQSIASTTCTYTPDTLYKYRTLGIYTIVWDNGSVGGPYDDYSPTLTVHRAC